MKSFLKEKRYFSLLNSCTVRAKTKNKRIQLIIQHLPISAANSVLLKASKNKVLYYAKLSKLNYWRLKGKKKKQQKPLKPTNVGHGCTGHFHHAATKENEAESSPFCQDSVEVMSGKNVYTLNTVQLP